MPVPPEWSGPPLIIVRVQSLLYSSLAASLLAAFIATLGKQWLNRYSQVEMRGSVIDRSRHRERKMNGMVTWHFDLVMEGLPLILQAALFLFGYALSNYLFNINYSLSGIALGFTGFGLFFYLFIVCAATLYGDCPFQTPVSLIIRFIKRLDNERGNYLERPGKWLARIFRFFVELKQQRQAPVGPRTPDSPNTPGAVTTGNHIELAIADQQAPLFNRETNWHGYALDSNCIAWMFKFSADADVILAIMKFIPEVVWYAGILNIPLQKLYDILFECFDRSSGTPVVIPKLRDRAYISAKALLHLAIQRKCIGHEFDNHAFNSISSRHPGIGSKRYEGDSDLESTFGIIDYVFGDYSKLCWHTFSFSTSHHAWMGHILLYRAWDAIRTGETLCDDVRGFVSHSLRRVPPPPAPIVTDCLFIIGLVLGIKLHVDDLFVFDKR